MTARVRFKVGDRVIVTHSTDWEELIGYYGHVASTHYDLKPYPMVDVAFRGRAYGGPFDPAEVGDSPYPVFPDELDHID